MTLSVFEFSSLSAGYGDTLVIRSISGRLQKGQVLGILGRNGTGKSTLLKTLCGHLPLTDGAISVAGKDLASSPAHERLSLGVAYAPQENVVFGELSVRDNLYLHLSSRNDERYGELLTSFPKLRERMRQRSGTLSGGERKLLSFVRTLGLGAPVTLMDEPTEGVQPENINKMAQFINRRRADGSAFIIVEQNLSFIEAIADQVIVLDHGTVVLEGDFSTLGRSQIERHLVV